MSDDICGEITEDGELCRLPAGWGRDETAGPCRWHDDNTSLPRMWTEDRIDTIYNALDDVPSLKHAAREADIGYRTAKRWKRRGKDLEGDLSEEELAHDDAARRLVAFRHEVNARTGGGIRSLFSSAIEYAHNREDPDAILRIIQQLEGGTHDLPGDFDEDDIDEFDFIIDARTKSNRQN